MNDNFKASTMMPLTLACVVMAGLLIANFFMPLVKVNTDSETGCEYMVNRNGGITPRIAADYMHMGCKGVQDNE